MLASERAGKLTGDHLGLSVCTQRPNWWLTRVNRGSGQNLLPLVRRTLKSQIREVFDASEQTYGMPRVRAALSDEAVTVSRKRVARLMRHGAMRGVSRRRGYVLRLFKRPGAQGRWSRRRPSGCGTDASGQATRGNP